MAAATITTSVIVEDRPQKDGRRQIRERHTDSMGATYDVLYMAEAGVDATLILPTHAANALVGQVGAELSNNISLATGDSLTPASPTFNYCTAAQFQRQVRLLFQTATTYQALRLGWYINQLGLTDAQLAALFGYANPSTQLASLKTHLTTLSTQYTTTRAQAGE